MDCILGDNKCWLIVIITYNEHTFFTIDRIWRAWTWEENTFLQVKRRGQKIMT